MVEAIACLLETADGPLLTAKQTEKAMFFSL